MNTVLAQVPIDKVDPPTANPRFAAEELDELAVSIGQVGILEPLIGVVSGPDRVRLVAGLRRFTSARQIGMATVPMLVHARMDPREELAISLVENLHRREMSPVESGQAFHDLMRTGMTQVQVGKMVGVSDFTVSTTIAIATKLCPEAREAAHRGEITKTAAFDMTRFPYGTQRRILEATRNRVEERAFVDAGKPPRKRSGQRAGEAETYLRSAITALHGKDRTLAVEMTERALAALAR